MRWQQKMCWIPIIIATGFREMQTKALHAVADDLAVKPFRLAELLARVHALLRVRQLENDIDRARACTGKLRRNSAATQ
jgi:DNA-binding response OmpR family regulator